MSAARTATANGLPPAALFDFDGTLSRRDSLLPFLRHACGTPRLAASLLRLSPVLLAYACGLLRNDVAKRRLLAHCLDGIDAGALARLADAYAGAPLDALLRPQGMARLRWHQAQGHACVLVSASPALYLQPWARRHGFRACIASPLAGANCHGQEKVRRIARWLARSPHPIAYAYGDSRADLPMLALARHAFLWRGGRFIAQARGPHA
ncbi:HAD-IB family hydrolase [Janthinobacterium sp.]|uniref:HAD-IB family hydrolase n=1 Tax=Janthinobacterium sp. TaxID=1871054 RepID=UPI0025BC2438|nr:HAD-IB family hydrolase [Janthinobacterium sp.]